MASSKKPPLSEELIDELCRKIRSGEFSFNDIFPDLPRGDPQLTVAEQITTQPASRRLAEERRKLIEQEAYQARLQHYRKYRFIEPPVAENPNKFSLELTECYYTDESIPPSSIPKTIEDFEKLWNASEKTIRKTGCGRYNAAIPDLWLYPGYWYRYIPKGLPIVLINGDKDVFWPDVTPKPEVANYAPFGFIKAEYQNCPKCGFKNYFPHDEKGAEFFCSRCGTVY